MPSTFEKCSQLCLISQQSSTGPTNSFMVQGNSRQYRKPVRSKPNRRGDLVGRHGEKIDPIVGLKPYSACRFQSDERLLVNVPVKLLIEEAQFEIFIQRQAASA